MAIDFPNSPTDGDEYVVGGVTYIYDSSTGSWADAYSVKSVSNKLTTSSSNPDAESGGAVGDYWLNTNTSQLWICVDGTADANIWWATDFDDSYVFPSNSQYGYIAGGGTTAITDIGKFPFSETATSITDVGDLATATYHQANVSTTTTGYSLGGYPRIGTFQKMPFSSEGTATSWTGLPSLRRGERGHGVNDSTKYWFLGGRTGYGNTRAETFETSFSNDTEASQSGDLAFGVQDAACASSETGGYTYGGLTNESDTISTSMQKFPFANASSGASTLTGTLNTATYSAGSFQNDDYAWTTGGRTTYPAYTGSLQIERFPFASDVDATTMTGTLYNYVYNSSTCNSYGYGYLSGGRAYPPNSYITTQEAFSLISDTDSAATTLTLTLGRYAAAGWNY
jgi:hypothetical protein